MSIYLAGLALIAAVSWAVSRPFFVGAVARSSAPAEPAGDARWRKRRDEALAAIRDADFDYQTGKLSESDYRDLRARLDRHALEALDALDGGAGSQETR